MGKGNKGTVYLKPISAYTSFAQETNKKIEAAEKQAASVIAFLKTCNVELDKLKEGTLKEAKGELAKLRPKATETQTKIEKLKQRLDAAKKEFDQRGQA